jgi:hypothetical protein
MEMNGDRRAINGSRPIKETIGLQQLGLLDPTANTGSIEVEARLSVLLDAASVSCLQTRPR